MLQFYLSILETESDRSKMEDIYNKYKDIMFRQALRYMHNHNDAEDMVHNSFLEIIKHKEKIFSLDCRDLPRYIVIIVRNKCYDKLKRPAEGDVENLDDFEYALSGESEDMVELLITQERIDLLKEAFNEIDEVSRNILNMKYIQQLSYKEIAEIMGIKVKYVDTRLQRAKSRLRHALEGRNING